MLNLSRMLHSTSGRYVMSVILGLGLASLFRRLCENSNCIVFYAPPFDEIKKTVYEQDSICYEFVPMNTKCNPKKRQVEIETIQM